MAVVRYIKSQPFGDPVDWTERELEAVERSIATVGTTISAVSTSTLGTWIQLKKTSDEAKTNNNTLANDAALTFSMSASTNYSFRARIFYAQAANAADIQWAITGPSSPTLVRIMRQYIVAAGTAFSGLTIDTAATTAQSLSSGAIGEGYIEFSGIWQNGANAGTFAFQWAQDGAGNASATTVRAGSYLEYMVT